MSARLDIDALKLASPCPARWEDMAGDDRARFCRHCQKHVYNFSSMTRTEVEQLVVEKEGNLCGRMLRRRDGTVLTADCPTGQALQKRKRWQWAGGILTGLALLGTALWVRMKEGDKDDEAGRISAELQYRWYELKVKLGWVQPIALPGQIMAPVHPPTGTGRNTAVSGNASNQATP